MNRLLRRALRSAPHFLAIALASPAIGQSMDDGLPLPPIRASIDERSVDLTSGTVQIADSLLSIGSKENGLDYGRHWPGSTGWRDGYLIALQRDADNSLNVIFGGNRTTFTSSGGVYTSGQGAGFSLTEDASSFTYTQPDGTTVYFDKSISAGVGGYGYIAYGTTITHPNGMKFYLNYSQGLVPFDIGGGILVAFNHARVQSVRTSTGFQLKYTYASNVTGYSGGSPQWLEVTNVRAINNAVDYCDPSADTCSGFTQSWPSVSFAKSVSGTDTTETVTDPAGRITRYITNSSGLLTGIRRPSSPTSNNTSYSYDGNGHVSSVAVAGVGTWNYTFTPGSGTMTAIVSTPTIPFPKTVVSDTTLQQPTSVTNENAYTTQYQYYPNGLLKKVTQPEGNSVTYNYDGRGNLTSTVATDKNGASSLTLSSAAYPGTCGNPATCNKPTTTTDSAGNVTNYYYNNNGQLDYVQLPSPGGGAPRPETHYTYWTGQAWLKWNSNSVTLAPDAITMLANTATCVTGSWPCASANQRITDVGYYGGPWATNMLISGYTTRAGDNSVSSSVGIGYDTFGNVTSRTDPLGKTTTFGYYADRQLDYVSSPSIDGSSTGPKRAVVWHYDGNGQVDSQTWATTNWDGSGYTPLLYRFPEYDGAGRQVAERLATGAGSVYAIKQWSYNGAGRLDCETLRMNPADFGSRPGACLQGTGGQDRITHYVWESAGLLDRTQSGWGTALQRDDVHYDRNLNGKTIAITDAKGNVTSYAYDGHDRQLRECYNASAAACQNGTASDFVQLTYDSVGRLANRGIRGLSTSITIGYVYDNLGRLTNANYPGGAMWDAPVTYSYNNLGQLLSAVDTNAHSVTLSYDTLGRTTSEGDSVSTRTMQYDAAGRRTRLTWPDSRYVTYQYNAVGEMTGILENGSSSLASFTYDGLGNRTSLTRGNGVVTTYVYDAAARLSCLKHDLAGGGTLGCPPGTFAASGQDQVTAFDYNVAGQITARTAANDAYAWDGHRNFNYNYATNGLNQYTSVGTNALSYDVKGNFANDGGPATLYTSTKNELVWRSDTSTGFYHNPLGQFDWVVGGGYGFSYVGDDITEERGDTNPWPILRRYVYGPKPDEPIIWYEGSDFSNKRYLVADERGSIVAVTNTSGAAIAINSYDEYGIPGTNNQGRFQYTGQVWVPELGMYSFKARIYSPKYGRFLQTDPAGFPDGPNWYNYANADPVNKADPSGMDAVCTPMADGCIVVSHPALPPINVLQYSQYTAPSFTPGGLSVGPIYTGPTANAAPKTTTPQSAPKPCPAVPSGGPGRDQLNRNIAEARRMGRTFTPGSGPSSALVSGRWFSTKVKSGGAWDYKNQGYSNGQDFGNFNYGATSEALGFDGDISDLFADLYSLLDHGTLEGEDAMIRAGQRYARMGCDK